MVSEPEDIQRHAAVAVAADSLGSLAAAGGDAGADAGRTPVRKRKSQPFRIPRQRQMTFSRLADAKLTKLGIFVVYFRPWRDFHAQGRPSTVGRGQTLKTP